MIAFVNHVPVHAVLFEDGTVSMAIPPADGDDVTIYVDGQRYRYTGNGKRYTFPCGSIAHVTETKRLVDEAVRRGQVDDLLAEALLGVVLLAVLGLFIYFKS